MAMIGDCCLLLRSCQSRKGWPRRLTFCDGFGGSRLGTCTKSRGNDKLACPSVAGALTSLQHIIEIDMHLAHMVGFWTVGD